MKFDILNREALEYIKTFGCRVLHLTSDVYLSDCLCIEDKHGAIEYLTLPELKKLLFLPALC